MEKNLLYIIVTFTFFYSCMSKKASSVSCQQFYEGQGITNIYIDSQLSILDGMCSWFCSPYIEYDLDSSFCKLDDMKAENYYTYKKKAKINYTFYTKKFPPNTTEENNQIENLRGLYIVNGIRSSKEKFHSTGRAKNLQIRINSKKIGDYLLKDTPKLQYVRFDSIFSFSESKPLNIELVFKRKYTGLTNDSIAISVVQFDGVGHSLSDKFCVDVSQLKK
jgi:phage protein U